MGWKLMKDKTKIHKLGINNSLIKQMEKLRGGN